MASLPSPGDIPRQAGQVPGSGLQNPANRPCAPIEPDEPAARDGGLSATAPPALATCLPMPHSSAGPLPMGGRDRTLGR